MSLALCAASMFLAWLLVYLLLAKSNMYLAALTCFNKIYHISNIIKHIASAFIMFWHDWTFWKLISSMTYLVDNMFIVL